MGHTKWQVDRKAINTALLSLTVLSRTLYMFVCYIIANPNGLEVDTMTFIASTKAKDYYINKEEKMVESEFGFFNRHGLIPPFFSSPAYGGSPYKIGLRQFVNDFSIGCSRFDRYKRISILEGYLAYRKMLHGADILLRDTVG